MPGDLHGLHNPLLRFADSLKGAFLSTAAQRGQGHAGRALPLAAKRAAFVSPRTLCVPAAPWDSTLPLHTKRWWGPPPAPKHRGPPLRLGQGLAGDRCTPKHCPFPAPGTFRVPSLPRVPLPRPAQGLRCEDPNPNLCPGSASIPPTQSHPLPAGFYSQRGSELPGKAAATGPGVAGRHRDPRNRPGIPPPQKKNHPDPHL